MTLWKSYYRAQTIDDALEALSSAGGSACIIAGGTDLILDLQQGRHAPVERLVDVTSVQEMCALEIRCDQLYIGAAVPINRIVRSPEVQVHARALVEAADLIGGPQVRNTATLGGNVSHALPAADGTIALVALDARVDIASKSKPRQVPIAEVFVGPGKSTLAPGEEILTGFSIPLLQVDQASAFRRVMRPQGVALPILNLAAWLWREEDRIREVRIAIGPGGPVPHRATQAEAVLQGALFGEAALDQALDAILHQARFRTSAHRATAEYRRHLVNGLLREVLESAWQRTIPVTA